MALQGGNQRVADLVIGHDALLLGREHLVFRCAPAITVSTLSSRSAVVTRLRPMRTARSAASLMMLANSAPEEPAVARATISKSTASCFTRLRCTSRIALRPSRSGSSIWIRRSKRRAQQCLVEALGTVRSGQDHHALAAVKPVHLGQQLVERLLALVVAADGRIPALADGVDLVDEDDAGSLLAGLTEEVTHLGRTHTDEHLHELRARNGENGTLASPATARAMSVLPVPGGPTSRAPLGSEAPISAYLEGSCRKSTISRRVSLASS